MSTHVFFFNDTATTEIYTLSLHDALPILDEPCSALDPISTGRIEDLMEELKVNYSIVIVTHNMQQAAPCCSTRSEEHTSELQSRQYLVCRLLLEKKQKEDDKPLSDIVSHV